MEFHRINSNERIERNSLGTDESLSEGLRLLWQTKDGTGVPTAMRLGRYFNGHGTSNLMANHVRDSGAVSQQWVTTFVSLFGPCPVSLPSLHPSVQYECDTLNGEVQGNYWEP
jgi:hypothetical protein